MFLKSLMLMFFIVFPLSAWAQVKAIATFSILGDVVKNVGGDQIDLVVLVGADQDVHTFEPTPKENILLSKADIIFENGLYLEHWIERLYEASGSHAKRVVVSESVDVMGEGSNVDPHIWQNVDNMMIVTHHVRDGLIAVDPSNAPYYKENAERYLRQLEQLDRWIIDTLKNIPDEGRRLVTSHDTLGYFAKRYGFEVIGTALSSATTEAEDPSAQEIAQLIDLIKSSGVKAVFAENTRNSKLIESLAQEAGAVLAPSLYTDALGQPGSEGDSYIKMMKHNVQIIADYLK